MPENNKTGEFLQKLAPCIERGELEKCVEEAARVAGNLGIGAEELLDLSAKEGEEGKCDFAYVLSLASVPKLIDTKKPYAYNNAGLAAKSIGKMEKAEELHLKALKAGQNLAATHYNYAILLEEMGRKKEAEEQYKKAIELDPKDANVPFNYALLLTDLDRKKEAEEQYKKAIELDPKDAKSHNNYANLLREKALFYEAEKEVRTALYYENNNPYARGTLGDILADEGYFEEAKQEYKNALKNPDSMKNFAISEITNNLGRVYGELKQYKEAKVEFEKAIDLDNMNVKAIRNLRKLKTAEIEPEISESHMEIAAVLFLGLLISFGLFWINKLSETAFTTLAIFFVALIIFVLFFHQIKSFKAGVVEFETSTGFIDDKKSQPSFET